MSLFDVDPQTGVVTLRRHLDSYVENYTNLNITILAQDMGKFKPFEVVFRYKLLQLTIRYCQFLS